MSTRNRVAFVSGLNFGLEDAFPAPGAQYQAVGAPGALQGPAAGFTVAFSLRVYASETSVPHIDELDLTEFGDINPAPLTEVIAGTIDFVSGNGWLLAYDDGGLVLTVGPGGGVVYDVKGDGAIADIMGVAVYVTDDEPYGGSGDTRLSMFINGVQSPVDTLGSFANYAPSGGDFVIGGSTDPSVSLLDLNEIGGGFRSQLSSLWVTPGIPSVDELALFWEESMDSGIVIPQAWRSARITGQPTPEIPESPTGNYFVASDCGADSGLGATWTDKIESVPLTLTSATDNVGEARTLARKPDFWNNAISGG